MLPPFVEFEPITIYNKLPDKSYKRTVIKGIWFTSTEKAIYSKGALPLDSVSLYIFDFRDYVNPESFTGKGWTIGVGNSIETHIFRGIVKFNSEKELFRYLDESKLNKRPLALKDNRKGPMSQQHLVILC